MAPMRTSLHQRALPWLSTIVGLALIAVSCSTSEAEPRAPSSPTPSASPAEVPAGEAASLKDVCAPVG